MIRRLSKRQFRAKEGDSAMHPLPPFPWIDVVIILALVVLNGLFAMAELAIVSSRRARLAAMAKARSGTARTAVL